MGPLSPRLADGGLATQLQQRGLPPATPVHGFLRHHPDRVLDAHRAFAEAGAEILIAGTFRALPGLEEDWRALQDRAVALAREAVGADGEVWGSIGPWTTPVGGLGDAERARAQVAWRAAADHLEPQVDGLLLETFTDRSSGLAALEAVGSRSVPVVLTWSPDPGGVLYDHTTAQDAVTAALAAGASATGFNCGIDPEGVVEALKHCVEDGLWVKPAGVVDDPEALARALEPWLHRCAVVGGCCGATPEAIQALGACR